MSEKSTGPSIPQFGMAAAAFACFLVIMSLPTPSNELRRSVEFFAVCIPLVIAAAFLRHTRANARKKGLRLGLWWLWLAATAVGDIGCGIGVYWAFRHISPSAAKSFLATAMFSWFAVGFIDMAVTAAEHKPDLFKRRKERLSKA
jgi:hypothetical protein